MPWETQQRWKRFWVFIIPKHTLLASNTFPLLTAVSRISCNWGQVPAGLVQEGVGRG